MIRTTLAAVSALLLAAACSTAPPQKPSNAHIRAESAPPTEEPHIPQPVQQSAALPAPKPAPKAETYSVVVNNVRVQELLFALARDAKLNVDVHPGINGTVTLNAIDQTLPQLLSRIAKQVDMRYELDGPNLVVMPDTPFLRTYKVDYVNMSRDVSGTVAINTQITSTAGTGTSGSTTVGAANNSSTTEVKNTAKNRFWESLEKNLKDILHETDKILPEGSSETTIERDDVQSTTGTGAQPRAGTSRRRSSGSASEPSLAGSPNAAVLQDTGRTVVKRTTFREAASVIVNPETGIVTVRATSRQHEKVQEFLDSVMTSAKRQVLIEATIAEVRLSENYQQGIDWQYLRDKGSQVAIGQGATTQTLRPDGTFASVSSTLSSAVANTVFTMAFRNGGFTAAIRLLESFGNVKVLSSPKLSVLNNQTALLKVVNNVVYFNIKSDTSQQANAGTLTTVTTTPQSVSVGLVMSVTPQIGDSDNVLLNVRPTISRISGFKQDPNPNIPVGLQNLVPEIETREMESVLRVSNSEIAVLGGLMQDQIDYKDDTVPGLAKLPLVGNLFTHRNDTNTKTELVIFLRPVVIREASVAGDYRGFRDQLPNKEFFDNNPGPRQPSLDLGGHRQ